jgi:hypothetical protein
MKKNNIRYISRNIAKEVFPGLSIQPDSWFLLMERRWVDLGFSDIMIGSMTFYEFCVEQLQKS